MSVFSTFFRSKPLFRPASFDRICNSVVDTTLRIAKNSSLATISLWDAIARRFYEVQIADLVDGIEESLLLEDFGDRFRVAEHRHEEAGNLTHAWLRYYYSVLPIMLTYVSISTGSRRRGHCAKIEIETISTAIRQAWFNASPSTCTGQWEKGFLREQEATWKFVSSRFATEERDDRVYDSSWLLGRLLHEWPNLNSRDNIGLVSLQVIKDCFPIFYDCFQDWYEGLLRTSSFDAINDP